MEYVMKNNRSKFVFWAGGILVVVFALAGIAGATGFGPSLYELQHSVYEFIKGPEPSSPVPETGCDQSATSTDCGSIIDVQQTVPQDYLSSAISYTEVASTNQSGKIDDHLTVNNTLKEVRFCEKKYKSRQIFIDGIDVVQRIAELASNNNEPPNKENPSLGRGICNSMPSNIEYTKGILKTSDTQAFVSTDPKLLPGVAYLLYVGTSGFDINLSTGEIYPISGFDGSLLGPVGKLK